MVSGRIFIFNCRLNEVSGMIGSADSYAVSTILPLIDGRLAAEEE